MLKRIKRALGLADQADLSQTVDRLVELRGQIGVGSEKRSVAAIAAAADVRQLACAQQLAIGRLAGDVEKLKVKLESLERRLSDA